MANLNRGEVPFRASGRDFFIQYGTREIAEAQTALGFHRPDPYQPDVVEEIDEAIQEKGKPKLDAAGLQVFRRRRILIDAPERQRRMLAAFEACLMNPDPEAATTFFRIGLGPWCRQAGVKLSDEGFWDIVKALGLTEINLLHFRAITFGAYLKGEEEEGDGKEEEEGEGKAAGAVSASSI